MTRFRWTWRGLGGWLGTLLLVMPCLAQDRTALDADFDQGLYALEVEQTDQAIAYLENVMEGDPTYVSLWHGAAAYWLGRAYEADDDLESAYEVWSEGIVALDEAGLFDPRLADVFVRQTFANNQRDAFSLATNAYLGLLGSLDQHPTEEVATLIQGHLEPLMIVLPKTIQQQIGLEGWKPGTPMQLAAGAGRDLVTWWRSRDIAPATRRNERLEEHLGRVAYAEAHYRYKGTLDDRGKVYIRLGEPSRKANIPFDSINFRKKVVDRSLTIHLSDFLKNEFWVYEHVDQAAQFLFYDQQGIYRLGTVEDLLPSVLRNGLGGTARGQNKARSLVRTMNEIYAQLALYHPIFATRYQTVAEFSSLLDEEELVVQANAVRQASQQAALDQEGTEGGVSDAVRNAISASESPGMSAGLSGGIYSPDRPDLFAQSMLMTARAEDDQAGIQRDEYVPQAYSNTFDDAEPLPLLVRSARFLDPDGTTRTEVYWGAPMGSLQPSKKLVKELRSEGLEPRSYFLLATVVQKTEDYLDRVVNYHRHVLRGIGIAEDVALEPQVYTVEGDTGTYHLALQWDQYLTMLNAQGHPLDVQRRIKAHTFRVDTLQALNNDERVLEMSDLKTMIMLDEEGNESAESTDDLLESATIYPFTTITSETAFALYFEVYHLAFGADDQTRFTVEYEVERLSNGGLLRFLGRGRDEGTSAQSRYTGTSRTAKEYILLDFAEWKGKGALEITLRITDEVTGQQVERTLPFELVKK